MIIKLKDIIIDTYTNSSGYVLFTQIDNNFSKEEKIRISFKDTTPISSSFYNSSIGDLIEKYGYDEVKRKLKFEDLSKSQFQILQRFIENSRLYA